MPTCPPILTGTTQDPPKIFRARSSATGSSRSLPYLATLCTLLGRKLVNWRQVTFAGLPLARVFLTLPVPHSRHPNHTEIGPQFYAHPPCDNHPFSLIPSQSNCQLLLSLLRRRLLKTSLTLLYFSVIEAQTCESTGRGVIQMSVARVWCCDSAACHFIVSRFL